jgi:hypothetical protein
VFLASEYTSSLIKRQHPQNHGELKVSFPIEHFWAFCVRRRLTAMSKSARYFSSRGHPSIKSLRKKEEVLVQVQQSVSS